MTFQESTFFIAEATTVVFWGMASDRFGRRSILIFGPLGLAITMLGFGGSKQFSSLVMFRFFREYREYSAEIRVSPSYDIFNVYLPFTESGVAKAVVGEASGSISY